ncbi:DUF7344 domain-containing protein [Haloarcula marina]|uniref:DUF7344 domain-containing protein n=1 Tax=Haloarcula marina TaxID=2961574 RepID=UPI0020B733CB|nr:hypothetical protein [Halomicroarcula marina]
MEVDSERDDATGCDLDSLFGVLASETRRRLLEHLDGGRDPVSVERLAVALAGDGVATAEQIQQTRVSLHHRHLPALHRAGLVEWDDTSATVQPIAGTAGPDTTVFRANGISVTVTTPCRPEH